MKKEKLSGVGEPIVERAIQAIPEKLYERLDSYFRRESTSPWTFPRRKQRESEAPLRQRRKYESYARSSIYIYIYFITHEKNRENSVKKKSSRVSFLSGP